jgi:hypothetical protein
LKRSYLTILLVLVVLGAMLAVAVTLRRGGERSSIADLKNHPESHPTFLSTLRSDQPVAKVGSIELNSNELKDFLLLEYQGQMTQAALSRSDVVEKVTLALDRLIEEELLAQAATKLGMRSSFEGIEKRHDLALKFVEGQLAKEQPVTDAQLRDFYKNHAEKFYIPSGVQLRELFIPLTGEKSKKGDVDSARDLAADLTRRIEGGESLEDLAKKHVPEAYRDRAQVHLYKGGVTDIAEDKRVLSLKPGSVIGPFRCEGGFSVFQSVSLERSRLITFREAKPKIQIFLEKRRAEELRKKLVAGLRQQVPTERYDIQKLITVS